MSKRVVRSRLQPAIAGVNIIRCRKKIKKKDGTYEKCHGTGKVPVTLNLLAKIRCGHDHTVSPLEMTCGHTLDNVTLTNTPQPQNVFIRQRG